MRRKSASNDSHNSTATGLNMSTEADFPFVIASSNLTLHDVCYLLLAQAFALYQRQ